MSINNGVLANICSINLYCFEEIYRKKNAINQFFLLCQLHLMVERKVVVKKEKNKTQTNRYQRIKKMHLKKAKNDVLYEATTT